MADDDDSGQTFSSRPRVCNCMFAPGQTYSWAEGFKLQILVPSTEWTAGSVVELDTKVFHKITSVWDAQLLRQTDDKIYLSLDDQPDIDGGVTAFGFMGTAVVGLAGLSALIALGVLLCTSRGGGGGKRRERMTQPASQSSRRKAKKGATRLASEDMDEIVDDEPRYSDEDADELEQEPEDDDILGDDEEEQEEEERRRPRRGTRAVV